MIPFHKHNCSNCVLVAAVSMSENDVDIYFCPKTTSNNPTWIARYSSDGPDYMSQLESILISNKDGLFLDITHRLLLAFALNRQRGN